MDLQVHPELRDTSPNAGTTSQKRPVSTPTREERQVRSRKNTLTEQQPAATSSSESSGATNTTTPGPENDPKAQEGLRNILFPTFKNLRRLQVKLTNANHHRDFLQTLKDRNQVPKGLKVKSTTTTAELPPELYEEWELAHVELSNQLRDIMSKYWEWTINQVRVDIDIAYHKLTVNATDVELELIDNLIQKATASKKEDLQTRRQRKAPNPRSAPGASNAENLPQTN